MFVPHFVTTSPFNAIAGFLSERYQIPMNEIKPPLLELVIDNSVTLELLEDNGKVFLIGGVVDPMLIHEDQEAMALLKANDSALSATEGVLAWDEEKKRLIFWLEVTSYAAEAEFNEHFVRFLNDLDEWLTLIPKRGDS